MKHQHFLEPHTPQSIPKRLTEAHGDSLKSRLNLSTEPKPTEVVRLSEITSEQRRSQKKQP
jgi:hypothetical protein